MLAVNAPDVYRTFLAMSPEDQINLGDDAAATIASLFGGSQAAFDAVNPLTVMKTKKFPDTAGFVVGGLDDSYLPQGAAGRSRRRRTPGMTIDYVELPGGHDWRVWGEGFQLALPWLANRLGLIRHEPRGHQGRSGRNAVSPAKRWWDGIRRSPPPRSSRPARRR